MSVVHFSFAHADLFHITMCLRVLRVTCLFHTALQVKGLWLEKHANLTKKTLFDAFHILFKFDARHTAQWCIAIHFKHIIIKLVLMKVTIC